MRVVVKWRRDWMFIEAPSSTEFLLCAGGHLQDRTTPQTDVKGTVFSGIFANNTLDFAKIETAARIHFIWPEKNSYKNDSCM